MALMVYQYIGIIIGIVGIIYTLIRFRESKMSLGMLFVWSIIWIILIVLSLNPQATGYFANLTGIGRGVPMGMKRSPKVCTALDAGAIIFASWPIRINWRSRQEI